MKKFILLGLIFLLLAAPAWATEFQCFMSWFGTPQDIWSNSTTNSLAYVTNADGTFTNRANNGEYYWFYGATANPYIYGKLTSNGAWISCNSVNNARVTDEIHSILASEGLFGGLPYKHYSSAQSLSASTPCPEYTPPDPCDGKEPDVDNDHDGICDRCDHAPYLPDVGKYLYQTWQCVDDSGNLVGQGLTWYPKDIWRTMPPGAQADNSWSNGSGQNCQDQITHRPVAEMQPCNCSDPCTVNPLDDQLLSGGYSEENTQAPETGQPGTTVPQDTNTDLHPANPVAESSGGEAPPESGSDNDYLKNIANNMYTNANNTDAMNKNLSTQLGDLADSLDGINETLSPTDEELDEAKADLKSTAESGIDEALAAMDEHITDLQDNDVMSDSWFSSSFGTLSNIVSPGSCSDLVINIPSINKQLTLSCDVSVRIKAILYFLMAVYTIYAIIEFVLNDLTPPNKA